MKQYQYLGIISSWIIIFTFLVIGPSMELIIIPDKLAPYYDMHYYFVIPIVLIVFYYALFGLLGTLKEKKITTPLLVIVVLYAIINLVFKDQIIRSGRYPFEFFHTVSSVNVIGYFLGFTIFIKEMPTLNTS